MPPKVIKVTGKANGKAKATPQATPQAKAQAKAKAKGINTKKDLDINVYQAMLHNDRGFQGCRQGLGRGHL